MTRMNIDVQDVQSCNALLMALKWLRDALSAMDGTTSFTADRAAQIALEAVRNAYADATLVEMDGMYQIMVDSHVLLEFTDE